MDSSDDVAMALLADPDTSDTEDEPQQHDPPPRETPNLQSINRFLMPFYELAPGELPPNVDVPTFVYANKVYYWTERNLLVLSAMVTAVLHSIEEELDMPDEEKCAEHWRNHQFEVFNGNLTPSETHQRARELQLKLDLIEMLLLGFRPDWILPSWFPSSLPPPILPPQDDELRSIAGLHPASSQSRSPSRSDEYEAQLAKSPGPARNHGQGFRNGSRRGCRQATSRTQGPRQTNNAEAGPSSREVGRRQGDAGTQGRSDVENVERTVRRGLRPCSSLRAPINPDGTLRIRPSFDM